MCLSLDRTDIPDTFFEILISLWCILIYHRSINPTAQVLVIIMLAEEVDSTLIMNTVRTRDCIRPSFCTG